MSRTLRVLCRSSEAFERAVVDSFAGYRRETGTDLQLDLCPLSLPELHSGIMDGRFDVAHVNTDWLAQGWREKALADLAPLIAENPPEEFPQDYDRSMLTLQTFSDGIAGLPFHDGPECLIYRTDLFDAPENKAAFAQKYEMELKPPSTWDEFVKTAEFFNRPDQNLYGTLFALYPDGHNNIFDFSLQVFSRGGDLTDKTGHIVLNSPVAREALTFYRRLIHQPFIHPESPKLESISASKVFARGEAAMMANWFGFATMCETVEESRIKGKVGVAPLPVAHAGIPPVSLNVYYTWSISAQSQKKQEAYEFIRFAVDRRRDAHLPMIGAVGCRKSTWIDPSVNAVIPYYHRMAEIHATARTLPRTPIWHAVSTVIDEMVLKTVNTHQAVDLILQEAQSQIDALENGKTSVEALIL